MKKPKINPLVFMGLIGMLTIGTNFATQICRAFGGNQDNWWTPRTMQIPVEDSKDALELFISKKSLQKHLADGTLFALNHDGKQYRVVARDITVRLNNWNKVKSSFLENAIISGVAFGIVITVLVIGLIQACSQKKRIADTPAGDDA